VPKRGSVIEMKKYYHGSPNRFEEFDISRSMSSTNTAQYGAGIYLTSKKEEALRYAGDRGYLYEVFVTSKGVIQVPTDYKQDDLNNKPLTQEEVKAIIMDAPDYKERLLDFGDIDYEGLMSVIDRASDLYTTKDILPALNDLGSDFYNQNDALFLEAVTRHTGITGVSVPFEDKEYLVIFSPKDIDITKVSPVVTKTSEKKITSLIDREEVTQAPLYHPS